MTWSVQLQLHMIVQIRGRLKVCIIKMIPVLIFGPDQPTHPRQQPPPSSSPNESLSWYLFMFISDLIFSMAPWAFFFTCESRLWWRWWCKFYVSAKKERDEKSYFFVVQGKVLCLALAWIGRGLLEGTDLGGLVLLQNVTHVCKWET